MLARGVLPFIFLLKPKGQKDFEAKCKSVLKNSFRRMGAEHAAGPGERAETQYGPSVTAER